MYPTAEQPYDRDLEIEVCEVTVRSEGFKTAEGQPVGFRELKGFVLKKHLP